MNIYKFRKIFVMAFLTACSVMKQEKPASSCHHVTERPYVINCVRYYPQLHYIYDKVGYASWYGGFFHGRPTATRVIFNKDALSAAHRTLPLPSVVKITNLKNGRSVIVVVNDRGPFVKTDKRIIDVSEKVAKVLNFHNAGSAMVRVTCIPSESRIMAKKYGKTPY